MNSEVDLYKAELSSAYTDLEEYSYHFAFVKDGEKVFHRYGCKHIEDFFVKNELPSLDDEIAELEVLVPDTIYNFSSKGYEPCEDCYTDDFLNWSMVED